MKKKKVFSFFDHEKKPSQELKDLLQDDSILSGYRTLTSYLDKEKYEYNIDDLKRILVRIETIIEKKIEEASLLLYHFYSKSGEWGEQGEQQVTFSFCRFLLKLPPKEPVLSHHLSDCLRLIEEKKQLYSVHRLSAQEAKQKYYSFTITLLGKTIPCTKLKLLDELLQFLTSSKRIVGVTYGYETLFIYFEGIQKAIHNHTVYVIKKEIQRSPNVILPLAAFSGDREVYLREESMRTIFFQKWIHFYEMEPYEKETVRFFKQKNISEGIKQCCFNHYDVFRKEELLTIEKTFVKDMIETVMFHELGHVVVQNDILPIKVGAICEGTKPFGETIYMALLELLADFSPEHHGLKGPLRNISDIAIDDPKRATRMFYMYMSDVWFYDTDDTHMFLYSDVMILSLLRYINDDLTINFEKLKYDVYLDSETKKDKDRYINQIFNITVQSVLKFENYLQLLTIPLGEKMVPYAYFKTVMETMFEKENRVLDMNSYKYLTKYWTIVIKYLINRYSELGKIKQFIAQIEKEVVKRLFILSTGQHDEKKTPRDYIFDRCLALGLRIDHRSEDV